MPESADTPEDVLLFETPIAHELAVLAGRLADASVEARVEQPRTSAVAPDLGRPAAFRVYVSQADMAQATTVLDAFRDDLRADAEEEPPENRHSYSAWAARGALRLALMVFLALLALGGLARLVTRLLQ